MAAEGSDFAGVDDIDPALRVVSGRLALAQAFARRLTTPVGSLPDWPEYGFDLQSAIGTALTDTQLKQKIRAQAELEEELEDIAISITRIRSSSRF